MKEKRREEKKTAGPERPVASYFTKNCPKMTDIDITDKEATDNPAVIALDNPRGCREE